MTERNPASLAGSKTKREAFRLYAFGGALTIVEAALLIHTRALARRGVRSYEEGRSAWPDRRAR